jgi:hypothetical protein
MHGSRHVNASALRATLRSARQTYNSSSSNRPSSLMHHTHTAPFLYCTALMLNTYDTFLLWSSVSPMLGIDPCLFPTRTPNKACGSKITEYIIIYVQCTHMYSVLIRVQCTCQTAASHVFLHLGNGNWE